MGSETVFDRAWHCRETGYTLGQVGAGCSGGEGTGLFPGWTLPVESVASASDYRAEIMEHVVDPCYLDMALRNPIDGVSPEKLAELAKLSVGNAVDDMATAVQQIVVKQTDAGVRRTIYTLMKDACIKAARGG